MALPKQVQEQIDEADRIIAAMNPEEQPPEDPPAPEDPELKVVEEEPPVEPTPENPVVVEDVPPVEPVAEDPPAVEEPKEPEVDWQKKYEALQGKYDSEVPQLHQTVQDMTAQMGELRELMAGLQQPEPKKEEPTTSLVTPEEVESFGSDFMDVVGRRAREVVAEELKDIKAELADIGKQVGGVSRSVVQTEQEKMFAKLDSEVEDWQDINKSQDFLAWLAQKDAYSGDQRQELLSEAFERNDADRVVAFFIGFKNEHAAVAPDDPGPASETLPPEAERPAVDLSTQVAPGRTPTATTPASAQEPKRMWTRADIAEFYKDVQMGKFKDKPDVQRTIEQDIVAAQGEGRLK